MAQVAKIASDKKKGTHTKSILHIYHIVKPNGQIGMRQKLVPLDKAKEMGLIEEPTRK